MSNAPGGATHDAAKQGVLVEVHLEELGQHSWWKALLNTLSGTNGSAQYRFVARRAGAPDTREGHVMDGATFPVMRWQDLGDEHQPNAWSETAHERLDELDASLRADGWQQRDEAGQHWWSRTYEHTPDTRLGPPIVKVMGTSGARTARGGASR